MTAEALSGIRVVDFTTGRCGGQATTVLADFGADVLKVEAPGGDQFRAHPSSPFWLRGKRTIELDLDDARSRAQAIELAVDADICVVGGPADRLAAWGLDADSLTEAAPGLIHCTISGFGAVAPNWPGYEGLVAAHAGRMASFGVQLQQDRPVYSALSVGTHMASQGAVHGILSALLQRSRTGRGDRVATSLMQGMMAFDLVDMLAWQLHTRDDRTFTPLREMNPMPTLNYHPLRTADGQWIQCGNLLEHLFLSFLDAIDLLGELLIDERYAGSAATWTGEAIEEARDRILLRMQERTADEWMAAFDANGNVAAEPILTTPQALQHRDVANSLVTIEDPVHGPTTQIGPIARLSSTPGIARLHRGAADEDEPAAPVTADAETRPVVSGRPLDGVTILDLSTIIAGPLGMTMLADLGARVIKVEAFGGDPFRQLLIEGRMAVKTNAGKESLSVDLKQAEGQAIVHRLVAEADVLVHNFRGEVPKRLGIDVETLHAINPNLIWAGLSGYSAASPSATRPATHPVIGAATGGVAYQAGPALTADCPTLDDLREASRQIMAANEANPDPNTSVVAASAILLALVARDRGQAQGQVVHIDMQTANAWANGDDFITYDAKPPRAPVDDDLLGLGATYRLYPAAEGWVFLAVPSDAEFARFCNAADRADLLDRFALEQARTAADAELAAELADVLSTRTADDWQLLADQGIGCVRADGIETGVLWAEDDRVINAGWSPQVDHARFGTLRRWGALTTVADGNPAPRPAPLSGEHTDALLTEFGYSTDEIAQLRADKIVNSEPVEVT
jgi:crotonobetainyl-CoA:carnitine CoA-transferase CaiB-like acyl-CoA transferase